LIRALNSIYSAATVWRRRWFARDASRRRRLARPVISVGNLRVGGSGKTPIVAYLARMLIEAGERPAILSRGYARRIVADGVTIVSNGIQVCAGIDLAGDEPLMLARAVPGALVLVGANRYLSGRLAEEQLGATVHVLDDGFQHVKLARDVDLLLVADEDLTDQTLPGGRLREPLAAASVADAALVVAGYLTAAERVARSLGVSVAFYVTRTLGAPRTIAGESVVVPSAARVFLVSGIAGPERFFSDVASAGWQVVGTMAFPDHHRFSSRDVGRIAKAARSAAAAIVLTTEKDAVRLAGHTIGDLPIASVPLIISVEPADRFHEWLLARVAAARHPSQQRAAVAAPTPINTPAAPHLGTDPSTGARTEAPKHRSTDAPTHLKNLP
jgi:tetraacyldisaccharide 4'-kinase